ncbi:hypothetical protein DUNSADRAFT_12361 [Dunaliella salina]|uniref:Encoded protein n=1 Tax=Dunaliella salina TaxID=3046 RepID=A0ABQ7GBF2_DUNSA|nr:hypothetical protein DUNSADRAFT_12361 [Dunaliella salina]|eukprot:KAF5831946.1 hypothetical protein DUNSADRAFT_12361 [Dunaliella salina]
MVQWLETALYCFHSVRVEPLLLLDVAPCCKLTTSLRSPPEMMPTGTLSRTFMIHWKMSISTPLTCRWLEIPTRAEQQCSKGGNGAIHISSCGPGNDGRFRNHSVIVERVSSRSSISNAGGIFPTEVKTIQVS